jgi:nucleoside-diphosphate-sugar epimerase
MPNIITDDDLILVTGASGFLATHCIKLLLQKGHRVRGTVRSLKDSIKCDPLKQLVEHSKYELELVEADLVDENSWLNAVKDCTYIMHTASPVPRERPDNEDEVIKPAVNGVLNVFKAAVLEGSKVKRIALTSSIAAIGGDEFVDDKVYSENDYSNPDISQPYTKSKILSERAAWNFVKQRKEQNLPCFELVVLNPGFIIGPALHDTFAASFEVPCRLLKRELFLLPDICLPCVDVRDVALAHLNALVLDECVSKRNLLVTKRDAETFKILAEWLNEEFKSKGYNVPTRNAPNFAIKIAARFDKTIAIVVPMLGKNPKFDNTRFLKILNGEKPIEPRQSIIDMSYSLIERGFIPKKY